MSDTPRTDEELVEMRTGHGPVFTKTKWVHSSLSFKLELELNAANSKIELLMSANADVARIAEERDAAEQRIPLLIAERDTARRQADQNYKLRKEFADLLGTDDVEQGVAVVRGLQERINRLEEWKDSAMAVEREWDANAISTMLGGQLGESQRVVIMREVPRILERIKRLEEVGDKLYSAIYCGCLMDGPCKTCSDAADLWDEIKEAKP